MENHKKIFGKKSGLKNLLSHEIENSQVIFSKPMCLSPSEHDQAEKLCEEMQKDHVIQPSSSPYNSPIVMV